MASGARAQEAIPPEEQKEVVLPSGVKYVDLVEGVGAAVVKGQRITVHYTGTLAENGRVFDSSHKRGKPMTYYHLVQKMIPGWNEGVTGMKPGGKRKVTIPPAMGYGSAGSGDAVPPNATLVFEIELISTGDILAPP